MSLDGLGDFLVTLLMVALAVFYTVVFVALLGFFVDVAVDQWIKVYE